MFVPNHQQKELTEDLIKWYNACNEQEYNFSGPAGSGKTTIINYFIDKMMIPRSDIMFMTYVGRAALNLQMKGINAKTIHSSIYTLIEDYIRDEKGNIIYQNGRPIPTVKFKRLDRLPSNIRLIIVDEGSQVPVKMAMDILSYQIPIIAAGDLDQLPPISGESYFLKNPNYILTEIMRQSDGSPIIYLSDLARRRDVIDYGKYGKGCYVIPSKDVTDKMLEKVDVIICGKNKTRRELNQYIRNKIYNRTNDLPMRGDKMICRKNNWTKEINGIFLVNGLTGICTNNVDPASYDRSTDTFMMGFQPDFIFADYYRDLQCDYSYLAENYDNKYNFNNKFDYGYAISCHVSQGSQYRKVLIYEEVLDYTIHHKWLYTAITRAIDFVILAR